MKKVVFGFLFVSLISCGGPSSIDTGDVKGTIEAPGAKFIQGTLYANEGKLEQAIYKYDDHEFSITPTKLSFEEECAKNEQHNNSFGVTVSEMKKTSNTLFYKENKDFAGKKSEGYRFFIYKKGKEKAYVIEGKGEMFDAIPTKEKALEAFKAAQTFEPAD